LSRDLNHHRNRHARPEFPTPTACQPPQTPRSDRWTPDFAGALAVGLTFRTSRQRYLPEQPGRPADPGRPDTEREHHTQKLRDERLTNSDGGSGLKPTSTRNGSTTTANYAP